MLPGDSPREYLTLPGGDVAEAAAVALIVAGSGETTEKEVFDLLEDAYSPSEFEELGLIVPVDKDLFTKTVQNALVWYEDDMNAFAIQTKGASMSRASAKIGDGTQEVEKFSDILTKEEFEDWDEVIFLVAMPEDEEDPDYDLYAEMVEIAIENGLTVKNLCRGLDDVTLADPEDEPVEEEPEEASEKEQEVLTKAAESPTVRKSRARKTDEPVEDPDIQEQVAAAHREVEKRSPAEKPEKVLAVEKRLGEVVETLTKTEKVLRLIDEAQALLGDKETEYRALTLEVAQARETLARFVGDPEGTAEPAKTVEPQEEAAETPKRGRGRPRENFEVPQIWDEDEEAWVARPKGRMKKGTQWRKIHAETNEVLDEGTA